MTWEQWLFEYKALHDREVEEQRRLSQVRLYEFKALRSMLIHLLGLSVFPEKTKEERAEDEKAGLDPDMPRIVPLAFMTGQPEVLKHVLEDAQKQEREVEAASDEVFDAWSAALLEQLKTGRSDLPGDMVPLLTEDLGGLERNSYWNSEAAKEEFKSLGIKIRPAPAGAPTTAPHPGVTLASAGAPISEAEIEKYRKALADDDG